MGHTCGKNPASGIATAVAVRMPGGALVVCGWSGARPGRCCAALSPAAMGSWTGGSSYER